MTRTEMLREATMKSLHKQARVAMPDWSVADLPFCIAEKKALAIRKIFEEMPLYIGEHELIVGTRTIYGHKNEAEDCSDMNLQAMPHYLSEADKAEFGGYDGEYFSKTHYTPDYGIILTEGIDGILRRARTAEQKNPLKEGWRKAVVTVYEGLAGLIRRYGAYARELSLERTGVRGEELRKIADCCASIAHHPPKDFWEACQLFWFAHLGTTVENFQWINYGRVDQILYPLYHTVSEQEAQQLVECLLFKMYDGVDIKDEGTGTFAAQINITLGGVTRAGEDAVNALSFAFIRGLANTRLPEPEVACRISQKNPEAFLWELSRLSVSGLNCMAYYNDGQFVESLAAAGIPLEDARDYGFDLCQDINVPGRGDFFMSYGVDLGKTLLRTMESLPETYDAFMRQYRDVVAKDLKAGLTAYNLREKAVREYVKGNKEFLYDAVQRGDLDWSAAAPLMSPLPLTSALYHGCVERGVDLCWFGTELPDRGAMVTDIVVGINALAAIKSCVYEQRLFTLAQVRDACRNDFRDEEAMRQTLWNAPKWGNDDDRVDLPAKEIIEFSCDEIMQYRTPGGGRHLAGIHQPHPVFFGRTLPATPEGRKAGEPVPVTLSPENGTMRNGATAAFQSAAKIECTKYQWNNCVMLQYFSSVFQGNAGYRLFADLLQSYFSIGGTQHQPNIVNVQDLYAAQRDPGHYRDLIIRMWGVSAHFVDLPRDVQDEFIARFENL